MCVSPSQAQHAVMDGRERRMEHGPCGRMSFLQSRGSGECPWSGLGFCSPVQIVGRWSSYRAICALGLLGGRPDCLPEALAGTVPGTLSSKVGSWWGAPSISRL